jgi:hypothetical protein
MLELLRELCHADGQRVDDERARAALAAITGGKAGRIARELLAR